MPTLLFIIFAVEALLHLIAAVGAAPINSLLWACVNRLPFQTSKLASDQRQLQTEYLEIRRKLNATSSQDEFAKWAKLRRHHDKLLDKLDAAKKQLEASRATFDRYSNTARLLLTKAPHYFLPLWYGKEPMFWLPFGWFPYYAEWIVSFPRAPLGSVSAASWQLSCSGFITLLFSLVLSVWTLLRQTKNGEMKKPRDIDEKTGPQSTGSEQRLRA